MKTLLFIFASIFATQAFAQSYLTPRQSESRVTYDLSASVGSINDRDYTEVNLGLNWFLNDWAAWRNAVFSRQGSGIDSVQGLDSSMRFMGSLGSPNFGMNAFAGPGVRLASRDHNAVFGEAGLMFRLGGLRIGAGAKALQYFENREVEGGTLPKNETQYFIILGGGGAL